MRPQVQALPFRRIGKLLYSGYRIDSGRRIDFGHRMNVTDWADVHGVMVRHADDVDIV